jgi:hypothetical protein
MHPVSCLLEPYSLLAGSNPADLNASLGLDGPACSPKSLFPNANQQPRKQHYLTIDDDSRLGVPVDHRSVQCFIRTIGANSRGEVYHLSWLALALGWLRVVGGIGIIFG